ncbi:hypothetical protein ACGCE5_17845 [Kluyvera ascorbata]
MSRMVYLLHLIGGATQFLQHPLCTLRKRTACFGQGDAFFAA